MSETKPAPVPEQLREAETSVSPKPAKRDFAEAVQYIEAMRGTRDFNEVVRDLIGVVRDPDSSFSRELMRENYPGWKRRDFESLLDVLNVDYLRRTEVEKSQELDGDLAQELFNLKKALKEKERRLFGLEEAKKWAGIDHPLETLLNMSESSAKDRREILKSIGFFKRLISSEERGRVRELEKQIKEDLENAQHYRQSIIEHPLEERQAKEARQKASEASEVATVKKEITALKGQIADLETRVNPK